VLFCEICGSNAFLGLYPFQAGLAPTQAVSSSSVHSENGFSRSHDHPSISDKKTSNAVRACSRAKSCAETTAGNNTKNNLAATSGILLDSALRQNFKKAAPNARSTIRTIHPSDALPHFSRPHAPCFSNFFSTNKTKQKLNHPLFSSFD
jgi:hypothetical protein